MPGTVVMMGGIVWGDVCIWLSNGELGKYICLGRMMMGGIALGGCWDCISASRIIDLYLLYRGLKPRTLALGIGFFVPFTKCRACVGKNDKEMQHRLELIRVDRLQHFKTFKMFDTSSHHQF